MKIRLVEEQRTEENSVKFRLLRFGGVRTGGATSSFRRRSRRRRVEGSGQSMLVEAGLFCLFLETDAKLQSRRRNFGRDEMMTWQR